jgi:two-component system sensor histidine kinase ChvG
MTPSGWLLAQSGRLTTSGPQPPWLSSLIYRSLLANPLEDAQSWTEDAPRLDLPEVQSASHGDPRNGVATGRRARQRGAGDGGSD